MIAAVAFLVGGSLAGSPAGAQEPMAAAAQGPELVDRIVAVVGDSVILESEVQELIERRRAFGEPVPTDPDELNALKRQELEGLVNELLLIQAAERDSVVVGEDRIQAQVDATIAQQERRFGGRAAFEQALQQEGLTLEQYRRNVAQSVRRAGIREQYLAVLQQSRRPPLVNESELRRFFEERRADLGRRPATIEFEQVVVSPEPSDSARQAALEEAQQVRQELMEGGDFEQLARRYSDDTGTREQGGNLGWFRRGRMVPEFERTAFALRPDEISPVVETPFGFHIIQVERIKGPERQARHILIRPTITPADEAETQERAAEVARALRAGAPMDSLIEAVHDDAEQSRVGPALQDSLPDPYGSQLRGAQQGQIVGPFQIPSADNESYAVVRVHELVEAGEYTLEDQELRDQIRRFLQQEKLLEEVLQELRRRTYIDIRY